MAREKYVHVVIITYIEVDCYEGCKFIINVSDILNLKYFYFLYFGHLINYQPHKKSIIDIFL